MSLEYIRERYEVPARRGAPVIWERKRGVVVSSAGMRLRIRLRGEKRTFLVSPRDVDWPGEPVLGDAPCCSRF